MPTTMWIVNPKRISTYTNTEYSIAVPRAFLQLRRDDGNTGSLGGGKKFPPLSTKQYNNTIHPEIYCYAYRIF